MDAGIRDVELDALATHLHERRDAILTAWRHAVERDPDLRTSASMSRVQFYDHIPHLLDALEDTLRAARFDDALEARKDEADSAEGHGVQRWRQGYDDRQVMQEWITLSDAIAEEVHAYTHARLHLPPPIVSEAWRRICRFAVCGISESVAQYERVQRIEAASRVHALEEGLEQFRQLERQRAEAWREAAHDLRGNLSVVANVTSMLQAQGPSDKWLSVLDRGVASLSALLNDLTTQARLDAGQELREIRPFDAAVSLRQLCANMEPAAAGRGLFVKAEGPPTLMVNGDEVKICRIAQNLVLNAVKYTERGGVMVTWDEADDAQRWFLCIADTGPGLSTNGSAPLATALDAATVESQAIERAAAAAGDSSADPEGPPTLHSRSDARTQSAGEGIGLSIVKRLCDLLDATLELQSRQGEGTTFRVTFPVRYQPA